MVYLMLLEMNNYMLLLKKVFVVKKYLLLKSVCHLSKSRMYKVIFYFLFLFFTFEKKDIK